MSDTIILQDKGLKQILKAFKGNLPTVRIGILGSKAAREQLQGANAGRKVSFFGFKKLQPLTNAQIGAYHEFGIGEKNRSFLRMPITNHLQEYMARSGAFDKRAVTEVIQTGALKPWLDKVAIVAERVVGEAFATGGFGQWKPSNMSRKENHQTLVETTQLRDSITSEVK